jgi:hypothetical protein
MLAEFVGDEQATREPVELGWRLEKGERFVATTEKNNFGSLRCIVEQGAE